MDSASNSSSDDPSIAVAAPTRLPRRHVALDLAAVAVIAAALYFARPILLPVLIAVLLTLLLSPVVGGLARLRLPAPVGAAVVMVLLGIALAGLVSHLYAPAQRWLQMSEQDLRALKGKLAAFRRPMEAVEDASKKVAGITETAGAVKPREVVIERRSLLGILGQTQAAAVSIAATSILLYFLLASGDLFLRKLVRVLPTLGDKKTAVEVSRTVQHEIGRYFVTITVVNVALGLVTGLAMAWLGLPNPGLWGVLVALLNFVPYLGPLTSLAALTFAAVVAFDAWESIVAVPIAFMIITFIEGQVIQPIVIGHRLAINPVVIFLAVMLWGWLWGIGGVLIAVPVLVAVKICAEHVPGWAPIGEFIGRD
jgi:predicted PurR-regulated permease PerM